LNVTSVAFPAGTETGLTVIEAGFAATAGNGMINSALITNNASRDTMHPHPPCTTGGSMNDARLGLQGVGSLSGPT
jgi:hypothetical protein